LVFGPKRPPPVKSEVISSLDHIRFDALDLGRIEGSHFM
jgi:hypothetical protein